MITPANHTHQTYLLDGRVVPSVTQVLSIIAKPSLVKWANRMGLQGIDTYELTSESTAVGTIFHAQIQAFLTQEEISLQGFSDKLSSRAKELFQQWLRWNEESGLSYIFVEESFVSKRGYGGTIDALAYDDEVVLLDWKTSNFIAPEYYLQLAAYWKLVEENTNYEISYAEIVRFYEKGFEVGILKKEDVDKKYDVFLKALDLYNALVGT